MKILVVALQKNGKLLSSAFELIQAAQTLEAELTTVILAENAQPLAEELASRGGGKVLAVSEPGLKDFNDEVYCRVISELISSHSPDIVFGSATFYGKSLFSRLAGMNGGKMASDATSLTREGDQVLVGRSCYGASVVVQIAGQGEGSFFVTIRPKIFPESGEGTGEVVTEKIDDSALGGGTVVKEIKDESTGSVNLSEADIIVSAGRGIRGEEHLDMVRELADSLGAALGASRAIVDAGWISYSHQVGQTGKSVNPKLYIAVGISGAIQHLVGMRTSRTIVAINKDKDAPIFNVANYSIVGDAFEIVPALTKKFKEKLKS